MPVPDALWADLPATVRGLKSAKARAMACTIVPPAKSSDPCWMIVGKPGAVKQRKKAARKDAAREGAGTALKWGGAISASVRLHGNKLILILDDSDSGSTSKLAGACAGWAARIKNNVPPTVKLPSGETIKPGKDAAKLAMLLKKVQVYTETQAASEPWLADGGDTHEADAAELGLSKADLQDLFGDDYREVAEAASQQARLLETISAPSPEAPDDTTLMGEVVAFAEEFEGLLSAGLDKALGALSKRPELHSTVLGLLASESEPSGTRKLIVDAGEAVNTLVLLMNTWRARVERLELVREEWDELEQALKTAPESEQPALGEQLSEIQVEHQRASSLSLAAHAKVTEAIAATQAALRAATDAFNDEG